MSINSITDVNIHNIINNSEMLLIYVNTDVNSDVYLITDVNINSCPLIQNAI